MGIFDLFTKSEKAQARKEERARSMDLTRAQELQAQFEAAYRTGRRIELAFLTAGGKPEEPVQGMVTPWDILGKGL